MIAPSEIVQRSMASLVVGLVVSADVWAGDWKTSYGVSAREQYTDNVCLEDGGDEDEWITTVSPVFSVKGSGGRVNLDVSAAFELNNLDDNDSDCNNDSNGDSDSFNPRVNASGTVELVSDRVFIDIKAQVQQNRRNAFRGGGDSNLNRRGNTNTTYDYSVSPYLVGKLKDYAQYNIRYDFGDQSNSEDDVDDSDEEGVYFTFSSVGGSPLGWTLSGSYRTVEYDSREDGSDTDSQDLSSISLTLNYRLSRKWQFYASTGEEDNDFDSVNDDIDGTRWSAGFNWTPNPRTELSLGTGDRFIGDTPTLNFSHRLKQSQFTASYQKLVTFSRSLRFDQIDIPVVDTNGDPLLDLEGLPIFLSFGSTSETRSPVVDERAQLGYRWSRGRTSINVDLVESEQTREEDNERSTFTTVSLGGSRKLSPHLTLNARMVYRDTEVDGDSLDLDDDSQEYRYYVGLSKKLGTKTSMTMNYSHNDRRSDLSDDEYRENRVTLGVVMRW